MDSTMNAVDTTVYDSTGTMPFGMLLSDGSIYSGDASRPLPEDNISGSGLPELAPAQTWTTPGSVSHLNLQDDSPGSSTSSSPQARIAGNRARASSLNSRLAQVRSTAHMTQQQINKKRQRATTEQLAVLEEAFLVDPSPNAKIRETISARIDMTERSVQIWFQNRRAKTKMLNKKFAPEEISHQQSLHGGRPGPPARSHSIDQGTLADHFEGLFDMGLHQVSDTSITRLNCRSLMIGSWRRVACTASDLVCSFSHRQSKFTYYVNSGSSGYIIEYPISSISAIDLRFLAPSDLKEMGRATISLHSSPSFFIEVPPGETWKQCTDFTEGQQATTDLNHAIVGSYEQLKQSFLELRAMYKNSFIFSTPDEHEDLLPDSNLAPGVPASSQMPILQTTPARETILDGLNSVRTPFSGKLHMPEPQKFSNKISHRRTRSRSAPIAIDLSFMSHHDPELFQDYYGRGQVRGDAINRYGGEGQFVGNPDFSDGFCTPTTAATSNYQDPWYTSSYANTPLLGADSSQLGSPMILNPAQFDLNPAATYTDPFQAFGSLTAGHGGSLNALTQHLAPAQTIVDPMPTRLDSVPEIPIVGDQHFGMDIAGSMNPLQLGMAADTTFMPLTNATIHEEDMLE